MTSDREKWRAELKKIEHAIDDGAGGAFFGAEEEDALALLERAYAEGRAGAWDEVRDAADGFLDRHWLAAGDRPSSPPAKLIAFMNELAALAAARKGTP